MAGRFGKYGDIKRKALIRKQRSIPLKFKPIGNKKSPPGRVKTKNKK